ncbi:MAG TPA: hypothetical protein VHC91_17575 [Trinickia sp.]|jgi:hypothetical protein|uniref:hypothetical protein n=1 Tax=Trinickia sp. TaxID=2571163 RepID=UPI002C7A2718|nr:hypothetical protein [Trinickia sp.]HVW52171.1 hypothetical protein [Trinickia sp.]
MHQALFASGISVIQPMHQFPMNHPELFGMSSPNRRLVVQVLAERSTHPRAFTGRGIRVRIHRFVFLPYCTSSERLA